MKVIYQTWNCSQCGKKENNGNFCTECGAKAPNPIIKFCQTCQKKAKPDEKFCQDCGQHLNEIQIIENDDHIEFNPPFCNIHMIEPMRFDKEFTWTEVEEHLKNLNNGKFNDWRLPTKEELDIIHEIEKDPWGNIVNNEFWTSSMRQDGAHAIWKTDPYGEETEIEYRKDSNCKLRCVR